MIGRLLKWIAKRRAWYRDNCDYHAGHSETYWNLLRGVVTAAQVRGELSLKYLDDYSKPLGLIWSAYDEGRHDAVKRYEQRHGRVA